MRNASNIGHVQDYIEFSDKREQVFGLYNLIRGPETKVTTFA